MPAQALILAATPLILQTAPAQHIHPELESQPVAVEVSQATPVPANAPAPDALPSSYPYASIQAGVGFPNTLNGKFTFLQGIPQVKNSIDLSTGFNGELAIGYKFPNFRTDLSIGYSNFGSQNQTLTFTNVNGQTQGLSTPGKGTVDLFTVMANAYYDFKIKNQNGTLSRWSPYVGAGIGWGNLSAPPCAITNCTTFGGGSGSTFAYQGKVGLAYRATRSGFVFLEGGYLGTSSISVANVSYDPFGTWRLNLGWRQKL